MSATVRSVIEAGVSGGLIDIECHVSKGLPSIVIVGYANKAVGEAKERVRSAFLNSQLAFPRQRITINLAPAGVPKDDTSFDLAIATAILQAAGLCQTAPPATTAIIGEVGLDGKVRAVRGIIGKLLMGRQLGLKEFYIPLANLKQALLVPNITVITLTSLRDMYLHLNNLVLLKAFPTKNGSYEVAGLQPASDHDFQDVSGQLKAKRALEIAAAGGHNILLNGPPGAGKSMLACALPSILPPLSHEEILEVTHLHSLASRDYDVIVSQRPFRAPHHSASHTSIIGGGQNPRPGEISLSHRGVLFFDEFPEFGRATIEALRQPLEDRTITVARAKDTVTFPANFILVATSNPCPCGYYGTDKPCNCLPYQIIQYQRKLSGPIIDRIDMYVEVERVAHEKLLERQRHEESSSTIAERVNKARQIQHRRFGGSQKTNGDMDNRAVRKLALSEESQALLNQAAERLGLSARSYIRTVKISQTIADLDGSAAILPRHVSEALQYRQRSTALETVA